jgi:hypothetical protein
VVISNITTVCEAYLAEGVRRLALAWSIRDQSQLDARFVWTAAGFWGVWLRAVLAVDHRGLYPTYPAARPVEQRRTLSSAAVALDRPGCALA